MTSVSGPMDGAWTPDGRMLIIMKSGQVRVYRAAPSQTLTFGPTDDATVKAGSPTTSFGSATVVSTDNSPVEHFLLRFGVNGIVGLIVESAKLRYCINSSGAGGDFRALSDPAATWNESTVTWNTAPSGAPEIVASLGTVAVGSWYEIDVTSIVTADGPVSLRVTSPSSNGADYSSKEGASGFAPQLIVTVGGPPIRRSRVIRQAFNSLPPPRLRSTSAGRPPRTTSA